MGWVRADKQMLSIRIAVTYATNPSNTCANEIADTKDENH